MLQKFTELLSSIPGSLVSPETIYRLVTVAAVDFWRSAAEIGLLIASVWGFRTGSRSGSPVDIIRRPRMDFRKAASTAASVASGIAAVAAITKLVAPAKQSEGESEPLPSRQLGSMNFTASILGSGGIYVVRGTEEEGISVLDRAFELGINYFDTATQYGNGESERRHGIWLERLEVAGRRGDVFLATKTLTRGYDVAMEEIEGSFDRLKTEYIDLLQLHAINDMDTWRQVSSRTGSLRAIEAAKEAGRVRHIGITNHNDPAVLLAVLEEYPFDSVLVPLGITDRLINPFVEEVVPVCVQKGISIVAMKVFAAGNLATEGADLMKCLHYTYSIPISTAIIGMASPAEVEMNVGWTKLFVGMTDEQKDELEEEVAELIEVDALWWKR